MKTYIIPTKEISKAKYVPEAPTNKFEMHTGNPQKKHTECITSIKLITRH
jgi:hypothetical protein